MLKHVTNATEGPLPLIPCYDLERRYATWVFAQDIGSNFALRFCDIQMHSIRVNGDII